MNPILLASLRRHWQAVSAVAALAIFSVVHLTIFRPAAVRYRSAMAGASGVEAILQPGAAPPMLPPRLFALITSNSLSPQDAADRGGSGALAVILLEDLDRIASKSGLTALNSEPGLVTQDPLVAQIRAHLRLRGSYSEVVNFFSELGRSDMLTIVERLHVEPSSDGNELLEVWISRVYLKQPGARS